MSGSHTPYSRDAAFASATRGRVVETFGTAVLAPRELPSIIWVMAAMLALLCLVSYLHFAQETPPRGTG